MGAKTLAIIVGAIFCVLGIFTFQTDSCASEPKLLEVSQGEILELRVSGLGLTAVEGSLGKNKILFYPGEDQKYSALVGIDLDTKPRTLNVIIKSTTRAGTQRQVAIPIKIKAKAFPQESFTVAAEFDELGPALLERIRQEQEQLDQLFAISTLQRLWDLPFIAPVSADISSPFGYRRVINGTPRAPHTGVDLRAPIGTEVQAANHGRVALLGDFFYSGKSIFLDHGGGLYTMYFHLSQFKVEKGMEIRKGDIIGLSGMTGRVTGPHLHWGARINSARVDPFELIEKLSGKAQTNFAGDVKME